jgi:uncharacterized protein (TIGR03437 family)
MIHTKRKIPVRVALFCAISTLAQAGINLPLVFEANRGQGAPQHTYVARSEGYTAGFAASRVDFQAAGCAVLAMDFAGSQLSQPEAEAATGGIIRYYTNEAKGAQAALFERIRYRDLYEGIDAVFYGQGHKIEFDLQAQPGADTSQVKLRFPLGTKLTVQRDGGLLIQRAGCGIGFGVPHTYQTHSGKRIPVPAKYVLRTPNEVAIAVKSYDTTQALIVDPVVRSATYLGGNRGDWFEAIRLDKQGNIILAGYMNGSTFPGRSGPGAIQNSRDALVVKLDPSGNQIRWVALIGGSGTDVFRNIAIDAEGAVYAAGSSDSTSVPLMRPFQPSRKGSRDALLAKFDANGQMVYATYFGGNKPQPCTCAARTDAWDIAVDARGLAYVVGGSYVADIPTTVEQFYTPDYGDGFLSVFSPAGDRLEFSTYIGGSEKYDILRSVALDAQERVFVAGHSNSASIPMPLNAYQRRHGGGPTYGDILAARINITEQPAAKWFERATWIGGYDDDQASMMTVDSAGNVYIAGHSTSVNFPVSNGAPQSRLAGGVEYGDGVVVKLNADLTQRTWATFLGASGEDNLMDIRVDGRGRVYVAGHTNSHGLPVKGEPMSQQGVGLDGYFARISANGESIDYLSYYGGAKTDYFDSLALGIGGRVWLTGGTYSSDLPVAWESGTHKNLNGEYDGFLVEVDLGDGEPTGTIPAVQGISNAASYEANAIAPGQIVTLFGRNIGPSSLASLKLDAQGRVATEVSGTRVWFDQTPAPVLYAFEGQTAVVAPYSIAGKTKVAVRVEREGLYSETMNFDVAAAAPGLFTANASGKGPGAILNASGQLNNAANPAPAGSVIVLYGTGEGQTTPSGGDGKLATGGANELPRPLLPARVFIGGIEAQVLYAGAAPGAVAGQFQMNAIVPSNLTIGQHEIVVQFGTYRSQAGVTVAVSR